MPPGRRPPQERSIGGTGRASLFPWGMAWNPVSEKYVVTDYFNYQVRQYNADWTYDKTLPQPSAATGDPESVLAAVAVDPRNGDMFVGKPKPDTLATTTPPATACRTSWSTPAPAPRPTPRWLTIDDEGYIYVLDSHLWNTAADPSRLIKLAPGGGSQVAVWDLNFPASSPASSTGSTSRTTARSTSPTRSTAACRCSRPRACGCARSAARADPRSTAASQATCAASSSTTQHSRMYVVDALQNQIEAFSLDGTPLFRIGGEGTAPGPADRAPVAHVRPRGQPVGDRVRQLPDPGLRPRHRRLPRHPASPLPDRRWAARPAARRRRGPGTGDVWVADTWNQRFCRYAADGTHEGCWGGRGNLPPYGIKYPAGHRLRPGQPPGLGGQQRRRTIYVYDDQANFCSRSATRTTGATACRHVREAVRGRLRQRLRLRDRSGRRTRATP